MDAFWAAPPVIRTLTAAVVLTSLAVYGGAINAYRVVFHASMLWKFPPELYRVVTAFCLTGPQLGIIMDPYFLYTYGSQLEKDSPRFPRAADFFVYLVFIQSVILLLSGGILGGMVFLQPLIVALVYTFAQENQRRRVSLFILQFEARFLPYAMLAMTLVMGGPRAAYEQATGVVAAHAYEFLTRIWPEFGGGRNYLQTPAFVVRLFGEDRPAARYKGYGTAIPARPAAGNSSGAGAAASSSGWSSALSGWSSRGPGRRLGGD